MLAVYLFSFYASQRDLSQNRKWGDCMSTNWLFRQLVIGLPARTLFPMHVMGRENLPKEGPFIIAAGPHRTELESILLASNLAHYEIHFFAKSSYWEKSFAHRWFMNSTGQLPISQTGGRGVTEQIQSGVDVLRGGGIVAIYPEGTRGKDGYLHKGHTGVARTAILAGNVPIIPVGMLGMEKLNPPGGGIHLGRGTINIGKPIYPLVHASDDHRPLLERMLAALEDGASPDNALVGAHARILTNVLMHEISRLSTAPYANDYLKIGGATAQ